MCISTSAFLPSSRFFAASVLTLLLSFGYGELFAETLPTPTGRVLLTISGDIEHTNAPGKAEFDYEMLEKIGLVTMNIDTKWTSVGDVFQGILARNILDIVGAKGESIIATAANDYQITIPMSDLTDHDTLLAMTRNGVRMRLRDKGPIWLMYRKDDHPNLTDPQINSRMIWQLTTLSIE